MKSYQYSTESHRLINSDFWSEGYSGEEVNEQIYSDLEDLRSRILPTLDKMGISSETGLGEFDCPAILLWDEENEVNLGEILITETGYEWRKTGFAPVSLMDSDFSAFFQFLADPKYRFIEVLRGAVSADVGIEPKNFLDLQPYWQAGYIKHAGFRGGFHYFRIGTDQKNTFH